MKISIVIPIYNVEPYLRQGIDSVINQSYKDLDIICVNDGSTDNSLQIIEEYAKADNRIKVCSQQNSGTYIARQVGVKEAVGDYILFFDPDDWLDLNACERIVSFIEKENADIIQYGVHVDSTIEGNTTADWLDDWLNSKIDSLEGSDQLMNKCYVEQQIAWNLIGKVVKTSVAKQAFQEQGHYCFSTLTDYFAAFYVYAFAKTYRRLDQRLYYYRHGVGVSTKKEVTIIDFQKSIRNFKGLEDLYSFIERQAQLVGETGRSIAKKEMTDYTINNALHYALNRLPRTINPEEWFNILSKETDAAGIIRNIVNRLNEQDAHQETIIRHQDNMIKELHKAIHDIQEQANIISLKNKKHLKLLRFFIMLSAIAITSCITLFLLL